MMEQVKVARRGTLEHSPSDNAMESEYKETDGLYPLVQSSNVTRPFGVEMMEERKDTHLPNCVSKWRFLATFLLTALVASMFLMRHWEVTNRPPMSLESEMPQDCMGWPSDHLACAMMYNISFSKSYDRISNTLDLNDAEFPPEWPDDRICISRLRPHRYVDEFHSVYWDAAFDRNKKLARNSSSSTSELDVVLLGDSITEHWLGTELSIPDPTLDGIRNVFQRYFRRQEGADVEGMALGISGDRCPQLQYRIRNGEMPSTLNPKVWWILIGTNDLYDRCTAESILFGIIGIVQEIQRRRPSAIVVVNSILPRPGDGLGTLQGYLWNHITWINERLHCYTEGTEGVHLFDATTIFLQDNGHSINQTLMPDLLHPSAVGCELWAAEIVKKVKELNET